MLIKVISKKMKRSAQQPVTPLDWGVWTARITTDEINEHFCWVRYGATAFLCALFHPHNCSLIYKAFDSHFTDEITEVHVGMIPTPYP